MKLDRHESVCDSDWPQLFNGLSLRYSNPEIDGWMTVIGVHRF